MPRSLPAQGAPILSPLQAFPEDNWWNAEVGSAPADANSAGFIAFINNGGNRKLHPDFGGEESPGSTGIYGFPYAVVSGSPPRLNVIFDYDDESDGNGLPYYPIPARRSASRTGSTAARRAASTSAAVPIATC